MKYYACLYVVGISTVAAVLCEFLSWLLVYRTNNYKTLNEAISKTKLKVESMKGVKGAAPNGTLGAGGAGAVDAGSKGRNRKVDKMKIKMRDATQGLTSLKMQQSGIMALTMILVFTFLNAMFDGVIVAKLPFEPYPFFQKMTHRNLPGTDVTDCAMVLVYMLCSISIRPNLQKMLGFAPPRATQQGYEASVEAANKFFGITPEK